MPRKHKGRAGLEVEAKLLAPDASALRAIAALRRIGPYHLQPIETAHLYSAYIDTPDMTLARRGAALRVRRSGRRWEVTLKWGGKTGRLIHERPELTVPLPSRPPIPFALPEGPLRARIGRLVAGKPLQPILLTLIHRQAFEVRTTARSEVLAELALDAVRLKPATMRRRSPGGRTATSTAQTPRRGVSYHEVEIELRGGVRADLTRIARLLRDRFALTPSRESKFARGIALLHPEIAQARKTAARRTQPRQGAAPRA